MNRRNLLIIISVLLFIALVGGISYSYFVYNKDVGVVSLETGDISINLSDVSGNQTLSNVIPQSDTIGKVSANYFDFTVDATVDSERIYYEIYLLPKENNTLDTSYLKTYLTDQNNNELKGVTIYNDLGNSEVENGKVIYKGIIETNNGKTTKNESKKYRLRLWLDESYGMQGAKTFDFDIYLYAKNVADDFELPYGANLLRKGISSKEALGGLCSKITWTDTEDDVTYLSGTNECIDMNYVWYSGKLWRIISIYPDGSMKLITDKPITSLRWGNDSEFNGSWLYQWLNEDFLDTLYNSDSFVKIAVWNYSTDATDYPSRPESLATQKTVSAKVGTLNSYEWYNGYRCNTDSSCASTNYTSTYLNANTYVWGYLTPYDANNIRAYGSSVSAYKNTKSSIQGIRPTIVLNPKIEFTGEGTKSKPYQIVGDKKVSKNNTTFLNSRLSGEYVKFDGDLYRIVEIDNNTTKLASVDYVRDNNGAVVKKYFASSVTYGKEGNTQSDDYWDYYLNNTWYNNISNLYKNMLVDGRYYLGVNKIDVNGNYKSTVCKDSNLDNITIKNCTKYADSDIDRIFTGKVGLLRFGEMFSTQNGKGYASSSSMYLITPFSAYSIFYMIGTTIVYAEGPTTNLFAARPTIHLNSSVKILSGRGTELDPYIISL